MPVGPYDSFEDCVAKNGDKASPEGFCAWLEHKTTGKWPSQSQSKLPDEAWKFYLEAYDQHLSGSRKPIALADKEAHAHALMLLSEQGWIESKIGWIHSMASPKFRTVLGVRIFASGEWTDSAGQTRTWKDEDLDKLVEAFNSGLPGIVPLKCGHTPDSFNLKIAEKLGIPVELVTGDHGKGQVSVGRIATLERRGHLLMASFERVPEQIADLIESGMFSTVSCEIQDLSSGDFKSVLTAVALLGAEEPAVDEATLDRALVFGGKRENAHVLTFGKKDLDLGSESEDKKELSKFRAILDGFRTLFDQLTKKGEHSQDPPGKSIKEAQMPTKLKLKEFKAKYQDPNAPGGELMTAMIAIAQALGLGEEATVDDILAAIEALKTAPAPTGEMAQKFQKASDDLKKASDRIGILEHNERVSGYLEQTRLFTAIPNKTGQQIAVELAEIEETRGKEKATEMLSTYTSLDKMGVAATKVLGHSRPGTDKADFEAKVTEYQKANPKATRAEAVKATMRANPALYQKFSEEQPGK